MRQRISINSLQKQDWINNKKGRTKMRFDHLSLICFGGGFLGVLLGLLLLIDFDTTNKTNVALKYRGIAVIFTALLMFGCGAHFMDKSDDEKRQIRKLRIEQLDRKRNL